MKKFGKFLLVTATLAAIAGGVLYLVKKVANKDSNDDFDDFDDFDDDFDDFDDSDERSDNNNDREYVSININDVPEDSDEETSEK